MEFLARSPEATFPVQISLDGATDIGGGRENQDDWFTWEDPEGSGTTVFGVLDGHGREVGRLASQTGKRSILEWLAQPGALDSVRADPPDALHRLFGHAHESIKSAFRSHFMAAGWRVDVEAAGYLVKRRYAMQPWSCVHGGTSCTIIVLLDGHRLVTANVGDSSAILGRSMCVEGTPPQLTKIPPRCMVRLADCGSSHLHHQQQSTNTSSTKEILEAIICADSSNNSLQAEQKQQQKDEDHTDNNNNSVVWDPLLPLPGERLPSDDTAETSDSITLMITADHSPESPQEFERLRRSRRNDSEPHLPLLRVVYDCTSGSKAGCNSVFELNQSDPASAPRVTGRGRYYKNVRQEWASLVTTPVSARFQDALAFTRSLGDLHLQSYGVSWKPEVFEVDVLDLLRPSESEPMGATIVLTVLACTDGVWDNWQFGDSLRAASYGVGAFANQLPSFSHSTTTTPAESPSSPDVSHDVSSDQKMEEEPILPQQLDLKQIREVTSETVRSLMHQNATLAKKHFGSSADNATGIVAYLWR